MRMANKRYIQIDEEGYLLSDGVRLNDNGFGQVVLKNIKMENRSFQTEFEGTPAMVEAFDAPLVAQSAEVIGEQIKVTMPYGYVEELPAQKLRLDSWDRFHINREDGVPIVLTRKAQAQLFEQLEEFSDDSITIAGNEIHIPGYLDSRPDVGDEEFWGSRFENWRENNEKPPWDLDQPLPPLIDVIPQLKILKQRVAVMGAGAGHDAHYFSTLGHIVTAFDISAEAIDKAKSLYPETDNLKYVQMDLLNPDESQFKRFDLVFEHTFFCAIDPGQREQAIKTYRQLLDEEGHLLANFFMITPEGGPPFGATEWEIRKRLDGKFRNLYWTRWRKSLPRRDAWELIYYGQKI